MRTTIKDIATEAGFSTATVSRVLNRADDPFISEKTRNKIQEVAKLMGYTVNRAARTLATGKTNLIEIQIPPFQSYNVEVSRTLHDILRADGYDTFFKDPAELKSGLLDQGWPVDGVISMANPDYVIKNAPAPGSKPLPFVSIGADYCADVDHVGLDLYSGTVELISHLIDTGCKKIVYLIDQITDYTIQPRGMAYLATLKAAGLDPEFIYADGSSREAARNATLEYVKQHDVPNAIFAHNDDRAIGACRALKDYGLRVPDDLVVAGCDGIMDVQFTIPTITTIATPITQMAETAWEFLKRRMSDTDTPHQSLVLTPYLVINESTTRQ